MDLAAWLAGGWSVDRAINAGDRFTGTATFEPVAGGGLRWHETGELALGGHRGPASRELRVAPVARGGYEVRFDDGRLFHPLDLSPGTCSVRHDCGDDVYLGEYAIGDDATLTVDWNVRGPGREDAIRSVYTRLPAS